MIQVSSLNSSNEICWGAWFLDLASTICLKHNFIMSSQHFPALFACLWNSDWCCFSVLVSFEWDLYFYEHSTVGSVFCFTFYDMIDGDIQLSLPNICLLYKFSFNIDQELNKTRFLLIFTCFLLANVFEGICIVRFRLSHDRDKFQVPPGFSLSIFSVLLQVPEESVLSFFVCFLGGVW